MKKITIGFSKSKKKFPILAWIIMWVEKTKFSHTYVRMSIAERDLVYQASGTSVHFSNLEEFNEEHQAIWETSLEASDEQYAKILQFCFDNLNKPYSVWQLVGILWCKLFKTKNPFGDSTDGFICSEISYLIARQLIDIPEEDEDSVTPEVLYEILRNKLDIT